MKRYLYDIETNALLDEVTTIWCVVIQDLDTREVWKYRPDEIKAVSYTHLTLPTIYSV